MSIPKIQEVAVVVAADAEDLRAIGPAVIAAAEAAGDPEVEAWRSWAAALDEACTALAGKQHEEAEVARAAEAAGEDPALAVLNLQRRRMGLKPIVRQEAV